jgi:hypothetical protein
MKKIPAGPGRYTRRQKTDDRGWNPLCWWQLSSRIPWKGINSCERFFPLRYGTGFVRIRDFLKQYPEVYLSVEEKGDFFQAELRQVTPQVTPQVTIEVQGKKISHVRFEMTESVCGGGCTKLRCAMLLLDNCKLN